MDLVSKSRARGTLVHRLAYNGNAGGGAIVRIIAVLLLAGIFASHAEESLDWVKSLTSYKGPGDFGPPPPMRLAYRFGWDGIQAATADVRVTSPAKNT